MREKNYNKILTIVLVITGVIALALFGFWGYDTYKKYYQKKDQEAAADRVTTGHSEDDDNNQSTGNVSLDINSIDKDGNSSGTTATQTYKGFTVLGKLEIPVIDLKLPILDRASKASMEASVGVSYGPGPNKVGNTVIMGHNYRNGTFFSKLGQVKNGDEIYVTDLSGTRIRYIVYNVYTTTADDFEYASRDTAGKREISLSTCTDNVEARTVVWAKEAQE